METPKSVKQCGHLNRTVNQIWPQGIEVHFPAPITIYIYIYIQVQYTDMPVGVSKFTNWASDRVPSCVNFWYFCNTRFYSC